MSSRSSVARHKQADRLDLSAAPSMVRCTYCAKRNLGCRLSSLHSKCTNCIRFGNKFCQPEEVPLPDYSKIDMELERIDKEEEELEAKLRVEEDIAEAALNRARQLREKSERLRRSRKLLRRREKEMFEKGMESIEELEQLEALESLNQELSSTNPGAPIGAEVVDWSVFWTDPEANPVGAETSGQVPPGGI